MTSEPEINDEAHKDKATRSRWRKWLRDLLLIFIVVVVVQLWQTRNLPHGKAPLLQGRLLDGTEVSLGEYEGQPVLVHFWATWCPVCRMEKSSIDALSKNHRVLSVATTSGTAEEVSAYLQKNGLEFPVILDQSGTLGLAWGVRGVPSSFVVDAEGQIRHVAVGYTTELGLRFRLWLAEYL